jgi:hypothetical protein
VKRDCGLLGIRPQYSKNAKNPHSHLKEDVLMDFNDLQSDKLPQIDIKDKNLPLITKRAWDALIASNSIPFYIW